MPVGHTLRTTEFKYDDLDEMENNHHICIPFTMIKELRPDWSVL